MADLSYAARLLEAAQQGRTYLSNTEQRVSASILARYDAGTPLNDCEAETFAFITANETFLESMIHYVDELRCAGHGAYGVQAVIERVRWDDAIQVRSTDEHFRMNDHWNPYIGRLVNELIGWPFFTARGVVGEPGHRGKRDERKNSGRVQRHSLLDEGDASYEDARL